MRFQASPMAAVLAASLSSAALAAPQVPGCQVPGEIADVVSPACAADGGPVPQSVLITFGELASLDLATQGEDTGYDPATGAFRHRGVTFKPLVYKPEQGAMSVVIGGSFDDVFPGSEPPQPFLGSLFDCRPLTRYVKVPLLATMGPADLPAIGVELTFDEATPVFGFGFGFNHLTQKTDGSTTGPVGWVKLFNERDRPIHVRPLFASRLYCCTEGDFDYVARRAKWEKPNLVKRATIVLTADYTPFDPQSGEEGPLKFLGIDWVRYQRTAPDCDPAP